MKQFSKVLLLSAVSLFVDSGNLTYASFEDDSSLLKSGIPTLHIHHTYTRHTLHRLDLSSQLFAKRTNNGVQIASVCFITDAGNCGERINSVIRKLLTVAGVEEIPMTMEHPKNFVRKPVIPIHLVPKVVSRLLIVLMTVLIIRLVNVYQNTIRLAIWLSERKVSELLAAINIKNVALLAKDTIIPLFRRVM